MIKVTDSKPIKNICGWHQARETLANHKEDRQWTNQKYMYNGRQAQETLTNDKGHRQ